MKVFQVDAFSKTPFHGNPAAVMPMEAFAPDEKLQAIASEHGLSETAFFIKRPSVAGPEADFNLRWFTPTTEVDLCGHATLAAAHVVLAEMAQELGFEKDRVVFDSKSGPLTVARENGLYTMDFPAIGLEPTDADGEVVRALGREPAETYRSMDLVCVFDSKRDLSELEPDIPALSRLPGVRAVLVTAPGSSHDFVCRCFAPAVGIPEDPVTGSAYSMLAPYWAKKLGKSKLTARQASKRGGELVCSHEPGASRVSIGGHACTYLRGEISL